MNDRRRDVRISPKGAVLLRTLDEQHGRIANLCERGIYIVTGAVTPPELVGRRLEIELRPDGRLAAWATVTGTVIRVDPGGLALVFDDSIPAALRQAIDELRTASHSNRRIMSVVLIDADPLRRPVMAAGFRAAGCAVVEAATPLEAIVHLGESHFEPDVIAVGDSQSATAMRAFVERDHPDAKLVAIGDAALSPEGLENWLSACPDGDLARRVRDVLVLATRPPIAAARDR
jgi:hypothetical protein